jgi:hypothetical protein
MALNAYPCEFAVRAPADVHRAGNERGDARSKGAGIVPFREQGTLIASMIMGEIYEFSGGKSTAKMAGQASSTA